MRKFFLTILTFITLYEAAFAQSVLITGANRGIGLGFVRYYLGKQFTVYATYRSEVKSAELLEIKDKNLILIQANYEQPNTALGNIKCIIKQELLDILILNAGHFAYQANKLGELEVDDFQRSFTINTVAPIILVQGLKDNLLRGEVKKIVAISSRRGSIPNNIDNNI